MLAIDGVGDDLRQRGANFGSFAVADGLDQQIPQGLALELELAEHVEDLSAERLPRLFQLLKQRTVNVAFAGFLGNQIPQMAHLGLADAMDTAKALFDPVRIPGQVVVDHQVGALKVNAFAGGVRGHKHLHLRVVLERLLRLHTFFATHTAMNDNNGLLAPKQRRDAVFPGNSECRDAP